MRTMLAAAILTIALASLTSCALTPPAAASLEVGTRYHSTTIDGNTRVAAAAKTSPVKVMVAHQIDGLVLIADGPVNGYTVPITIEGSTVTPDNDRHAGVTTVACADSSAACIVDRWVGTWAIKSFRVSATRQGLRITEGTLTIDLRK